MKSLKHHPFAALALAAQPAFAVDGTTAGADANATINWDATATFPWTNGIVADGAGRNKPCASSSAPVPPLSGGS